MSRVRLYKNPFMLGFEGLDRMFEESIKRNNATTEDSYPPYNVEQLDDNKLRITLAVAGFTDRDIEAYMENTQLVIKGKIKEKAASAGSIYLYRGIALRQFQRRFLLAEGLEIKGAKLSCGLLEINLERKEQSVKINPIKIETQE